MRVRECVCTKERVVDKTSVLFSVFARRYQDESVQVSNNASTLLRHGVIVTVPY